jgi:hypothetical protein
MSSITPATVLPERLPPIYRRCLCWSEENANCLACGLYRFRFGRTDVVRICSDMRNRSSVGLGFLAATNNTY